MGLCRGREITVCTRNYKRFGLIPFLGTLLPGLPPSTLQNSMAQNREEAWMPRSHRFILYRPSMLGSPSPRDVPPAGLLLPREHSHAGWLWTEGPWGGLAGLSFSRQLRSR